MSSAVPAFARDALVQDEDETALGAAERAELLRTHRAVMATIEALGMDIERTETADRDDLIAREERYFEREDELREAYLASLRPLAVSRCPFTQEIFWRAIDTAGLDGLWWRAEAAVRPFDRPPRTFVALSGAMRLGTPIARAPFIAEPGPAVPFVLPRLLAGGGKAVICTVPVGPHTGYAIAYFAEHPTLATPRVNEWGGDGYAVVDERGAWWWDERPEDPSERDFALRPWLERGALLWIAPGDASLALRTGAAGCAYLDLAGAHATQRVEDGVAR